VSAADSVTLVGVLVVVVGGAVLIAKPIAKRIERERKDAFKRIPLLNRSTSAWVEQLMIVHPEPPRAVSLSRFARRAALQFVLAAGALVALGSLEGVPRSGLLVGCAVAFIGAMERMLSIRRAIANGRLEHVEVTWQGTALVWGIGSWRGEVATEAGSGVFRASRRGPAKMEALVDLRKGGILAMLSPSPLAAALAPDS
jgi:hypothetical protein